MSNDPFQLHLVGSPLGGLSHYSVMAHIGQSPLGDAGAWGTQFNKGGPSEAVRLWSFHRESLTVQTLLLNVPSDEQAARRADLEELLGTSAKFGVHMLIEWLLNHPDNEVRMRFIALLSNPGRHTPMFEGIR